MGFRKSFTVEGLNLERFVQRAGEKGIMLHRIIRSGARRFSAQTDEAVFAQLAELADQGGWIMTPGKRVGAGRTADRLLGRRWLLVGICLMAALCMAGARMIWRVQIIGAGAYEPDVMTALEELGVAFPMSRGRIVPGAIRDALEWRYPEVAWVEVGLRGATLEIRLVDGVTGQTEAAPCGPCNVVAVQDGVVQRIITRAGTPVVKPGDVVRKGDVLIKGEERTSGEQVRLVAARGSVFARVWISAAVTMPLNVTETDYTGRTWEEQIVTSPWFPLWQGKLSEFAHEDIAVHEMPLGGFIWPLMFREEIHHEADYRSVKADLQSVIDDAERAARRKLLHAGGGSESLVDIWVNWSIIKDEILLSVATGEKLVDIARQERSSGMAATE